MKFYFSDELLQSVTFERNLSSDHACYRLEVGIVTVPVGPHWEGHAAQFGDLLAPVVRRAPAQGHGQRANVVSLQVAAEWQANGLDMSEKSSIGIPPIRRKISQLTQICPNVRIALVENG